MVYSYAWKEVFNPGDAQDFFQDADLHSFSVDTTTYRRANAWWLSELSRLIYVRGVTEFDGEHQSAIRNVYLRKVGLKERWFHNGDHVQCAIIDTLPNYGRTFSVLVFRGTQGRMSNWAFNFSTALSPWPGGGYVHRGFKMLLLEAWRAIEEELKKQQEPIYYTGHSMGGALAVLAASLLEPAAVYTFGSPRMGNNQFIHSTRHVPIYRVVNPRDIVASVPPIPGILHVGEPQYLNSLKDNAPARSWFDAPGFLADHSPANYSVQL